MATIDDAADFEPDQLNISEEAESVDPAKLRSSEESVSEYDEANPSGMEASGGVIDRAVAEATRGVRRPKVSESQFGTSVEGLSERAIATRMGIAPGSLRERINVGAGKTQPQWKDQKNAAEKVAQGGPIRDVRFKASNPYAAMVERLPAGVAGPVLPLTSVPKSQFRPENVEVFDPSETVQTGNPEFPASLEMQRAPVEDVVQQQAIKRASEQKRSYEAKGKRVGTPAAPISVKSKYDLTDEEKKGGIPLAKTGFASDAGQEGPAAPVDRDVRDVVRTDGGRGIDSRTGGVVLTQGKTSYGPPRPSSATAEAEAAQDEMFGKYGLTTPPELRPDVKMDYSRQATINGKTYSVSRPALRPGHPLTEKWIKERGDAAAAAAPTETPLAQAGGDPRGGQRAIRARMEEAAPAIAGVPDRVREELERAEMFGENVVERTKDIYTGVGLEPRDPENLTRGRPHYYRAGAGGGDQGGIAIPKGMLPGKGAVTTSVPEAPTGEEVEAPKTLEEQLSGMSGADILSGARAAGMSLEAAPEGQTAPIDVPGVRGKISDIARIRQQAWVDRRDIDEQQLAALTMLPEETRADIEGLMRPSLIGKDVSGQTPTSGATGINEVRKIQKGGDEAARAREARNMAVSLTATQFKKLPEGVEGPVLPMTKANVDAVIGAERARLAQQAGSFPAQPGEQGREGRSRKNLETLLIRNIAGGQKEADEAVNRALGLAGPGGGSVPAPRSPEERRGGGRRQQ